MIAELIEKRARLHHENVALLNKAKADGRDVLNSDEEAEWQARDAAIDALTKNIGMREKQERIDAALSQTERRTDPNPVTESRDGGRTSAQGMAQLRQGRADSELALRGWFLAGSDHEPAAEYFDAGRRVGLDIRNKYLNINLRRSPLRDLRREQDWWDQEQRAQSTATGGAGAFTVPDETMRTIEVALLTFGGMRQVSDVIRTGTGADLPYPMNNDSSNVGEIIGQNSQVNQQDLVFTQMVLQAFKYSSKMILVPVEFLQDSSINVPAFIGNALGTRIGRITNTHFTTGDGSSKPNGVVTAATSGKAGLTGQTTTVIYDDLVDLLHSVDPAYREGSRFMFNDATLRALRKIKTPQFTGDTAGQPLWQPGMQQGLPDTILGYPYTVNQDVATMAANARSILFGQFMNYKIRDVTEINLLRLDERYAEFHQVAFLAFSRHDGDLLDAGTHPIKYYSNSAT